MNNYFDELEKNFRLILRYNNLYFRNRVNENVMKAKKVHETFDKVYSIMNELDYLH